MASFDQEANESYIDSVIDSLSEEFWKKVEGEGMDEDISASNMAGMIEQGFSLLLNGIKLKKEQDRVSEKIEKEDKSLIQVKCKGCGYRYLTDDVEDTICIQCINEHLI